MAEFEPVNVVIANESLFKGLKRWLHNNGLELLEMPVGADELTCYIVGIKTSPKD